MALRPGDDPVDELPTAGAALPRPRRSMPRELVSRLAGQVGRVAGDQVELAIADRLVEVAPLRVHTDAVERRVQPHREYCPPRDVDGSHAGPAKRCGDRDRATARAEIENRRFG